MYRMLMEIQFLLLNVIVFQMNWNFKFSVFFCCRHFSWWNLIRELKFRVFFFCYFSLLKLVKFGVSFLQERQEKIFFFLLSVVSIIFPSHHHHLIFNIKIELIFLFFFTKLYHFKLLHGSLFVIIFLNFLFHCYFLNFEIK